MSAEVSILLDTRRQKEKGVYPVKMRVYHNGKAELFQTIYNLSKEDYVKLKAKRIGDKLSVIRTALNELEKEGQRAADLLDPFDFQQFFQQFIYDNKHFKQKKAKVQKLIQKSESNGFTEEELKKFPLLSEQHPGPDYLSVIYCFIVKSLLRQKRVSTAVSYQVSYSSFKKFKGNIRFKQITEHYLKEYEAWMINTEGNSKTTVGFYVRALRAVYNEAVSQKLIKRDNYPFVRHKYGIPTGRNIKKAMGKQMIAKIYNTPAKRRS